jgi:hypothetical protein
VLIGANVMFKYFEKRKLVKFKKHLKNPKIIFSEGYLEFHKNRIEWLDWLIAYYEGKTIKPKILLESLIKLNLNNYNEYVEEMIKFNLTPLSEIDKLKNLIKQIDFIYQWVYYKNITGF